MIENTLEGAEQINDMPLTVKPKTRRKFSSYFVNEIETDEPVVQSKLNKVFSSLFVILRKPALVVSFLVTLGSILITVGVMLAFSFALGLIVCGTIILTIGVLLGIDFVRSA